MKNKITLGLFSLTLVGQLAYSAVPYHGKNYQFTQPNGDVITLTLTGNDYFAEQRTKSGRLVVYDNQLKGMAYAQVSQDGSQLISTGKLAVQSDNQLPMISTMSQQGLTAAAKGKLALKKRQAMLKVKGDTPLGNTLISTASSSTVTGSLKGLTVIIDFPDKSGSITKSQVEHFLNDLDYHEFGNFQSIRGYFRSVSGGKLDYTNVVTTYYTAKHKKSYYADSSLESSVRSQELIHEALDWLENQQGFDFSTLSTDSQGLIKGLNFFYAGDSDSSWARGLWPHMGGLSPRFCADGVCSNLYQISDMGSRLSIGTFAHESGHLIAGWPDLYDYDGSSLGSVASFGIMGYGSASQTSQLHPVPPVAPLRALAGWDSVTELNPAINANAPQGRLSATSGSNTDYKWSNPANPKEAFYIEAIHRSGQNTEQPDQGLAVWHVDPAGDNSNEWHPYIQMEHADALRDPENNRNYGDNKDLYHEYGEFTASLPNALTSKGTNSLWWNGNESGLNITDVSAPAETISFTVTPGDVTTPTTPTTPSDTVVYTGSLTEKGEKIEPDGNWFQYDGGTIKLALEGPSNTDFDLKIMKWDNQSSWVQVAASEASGSSESITYQAEQGYYYFSVKSYSGSGQYQLSVTK
ncbi:Aqualysin-1 precursor [Vibrio aerogenes CECT 7868]|uniref:Aqualysin-1 n=1 Tax=Vibrio aerogenes CECT 7868 TaxID=1216006 RepID=A0A1M6CTY7_9VIBR|nr:M6 family metalloprotease domain-containing protein [Vibrio aerogenes]SHI64218.1 Aqualysin-1 precursor [Vibrio aerogenes CECT 7868]